MGQNVNENKAMTKVVIAKIAIISICMLCYPMIAICKNARKGF